MEVFGIHLFFYAIIGVGITLLILTLVQTNKVYLGSLGFSSDLIQFAQKYTLVRNALTLIYLIGIIYLTNHFIDQWNLAVSDYLILAINVMAILVLIVPLVIVDRYLWERSLKRKVVHDNLEITIDFKHKGLKLIFNPWIAGIITLFTVLYSSFVIHPFFMIYIHLALPWLFYHSLKNKYYLSATHLKQSYVWTFIGITINYIFVMYYVLTGFLENFSSMGLAGYISGLIIFMLLVGSIIFHTFNIIDFKRITRLL